MLGLPRGGRARRPAAASGEAGAAGNARKAGTPTTGPRTNTPRPETAVSAPRCSYLLPHRPGRRGGRTRQLLPPLPRYYNNRRTMAPPRPHCAGAPRPPQCAGAIVRPCAQTFLHLLLHGGRGRLPSGEGLDWRWRSSCQRGACMEWRPRGQSECEAAAACAARAGGGRAREGRRLRERSR